MDQWGPDQRLAFGARLKDARTLKKLTLVNVADMFEATKQSVSSWEAGRNMPSAEQLARMAEEFGQPVDWLLYGRRSVPAVPLPPKAQRMVDLYMHWLKRDPERAQVMYATMVALAGSAGGPGDAPVSADQPLGSPSPSQH